jgi:hypothetical protein
MGLAAVLADTWPHKAQSAVAVASAIRTRFFISALTMPIIMILTAVLLYRTGATWHTNLLVVALLVGIWWADMRSSVIDQILYFDGEAVRVQVLDTAIAAGRMAAIVLLWLLHGITVLAALVIHVFTFLVRIPYVQRWVHAALDLIHGEPEDGTKRRIRAIALRQVPVDIFTVVQSQAAMFFLTHHAGSFELATYGALGRVAQLLAPFSALSLAFFTPAFAKERDRILARITGYALFGSIPAFGLVAACIVAPHLVLILLGPAYASQVSPLIVFAVCSLITNFVQIVWSLSAHRGWNQWSWLRIPIGLVWCVVAPFVIPVGTASGAFVFFAGFSVGTGIALAIDLYTVRRRGEISLLGLHALAGQRSSADQPAFASPADDEMPVR